jgi:outer membrane receptor protein involved in Fe transport
MAPLATSQVFGRFSYELTDDVNVYLQASYNKSEAKYNYLPSAFLNVPIRSGNAFLNPSIQQIMTANNIANFTLARRNDQTTPYDPLQVEPLVNSVFVKTGIDGSLFGDFKWNANYAYARNTQRVIYHNNVNNEKLAAASDAVINPANGRTVCQISLTAFAGRFPDCEPINLFGPTSITPSALDFVSEDTRFTLANVMHNVNASIAGSPFSIWAGPVNVAISGEYRWASLTNNSNAQPTRPFDCTGLRAPCSTTTPTYSSNTVTNMRATQNVKEVAAEALIPLLKDLPVVQSLELNLAGRYTDYSTSGTVKTWKVGGSWEVSDELRLRGTRSKDIRAPTLTDLFQPLSGGPTGYLDLHTGINGILSVFSQGNPNLVPEVAKTTTLGAVYQPSWLPRFSLAVDYFDIQMNNSITTQGVGNTVQRECEDSNGASPLCANFVRPLPFSDRTAANYPLKGFSQGLNAQKQWTSGWDVEANYRTDLADVFASAPGSVALRGLVSYQPHLRTKTLASAPPSEASGIATGFGATPGMSKLRVNASLNYTLDKLNVVLTERWQSKQQPSNRAQNTDLRPDIPAFSYTDISINYKTEIAGHTFTPFLTVENLFDKAPPIGGHGGSIVGLVFPSYGGYDVVGRFFTLGVRATY